MKKIIFSLIVMLIAGCAAGADAKTTTKKRATTKKTTTTHTATSSDAFQGMFWTIATGREETADINLNNNCFKGNSYGHLNIYDGGGYVDLYIMRVQPAGQGAYKVYCSYGQPSNNTEKTLTISATANGIKITGFASGTKTFKRTK